MRAERDGFGAEAASPVMGAGVGAVSEEGTRVGASVRDMAGRWVRSSRAGSEGSRQASPAGRFALWHIARYMRMSKTPLL
ncbi:hypothetical protein GCM10022293_10290 [Azospirillum formosense]